MKSDKKTMINVGHGIVREKVASNDKHDPFAGGFGVRGNTLIGKVISSKAAKTVTIQMERQVRLAKYKRYMTKTYKVQAHNPASINAKDGDVVKIMETRPISKTKHFCVVEIMKSETQ